MTQEIKPAYVTFEQAKFIRYPFLTDTGYSFSGKTIQRKYIITDGWINRPEQWQVVEWLRINHGIIVLVLPDNKDDFIDTRKVIYTPVIYRVCEGLHNLYKELIRDKEGNSIKYFNSPQEAYSSAFDYIKDNNLI
jgi:hypothetical protein